MINDCLLILGAGSSVEYNYPTGKGIINNIINDFVNDLGSLTKNELSPGITSERRVSLLEDARLFVDALIENRPTSIDMFLSWKKPKFDSIGKIAIAYAILKSEFGSAKNNFSAFHDSPDNWQRILFNQLTDGHYSSDASGLNINCKIVSFNYDRSFEVAFNRFFSGNFNPRDGIILRNKLKVKHVYGCIEDENPFEDYGKTFTFPKIIEASSRIKVMYQERIDPNISKYIEGARNILILGFGFDDFNLKHLNFPSALKDITAKISGTTLGISNTRVEKLSRELKINNSIVRLEEINCSELLRKYL